MRSQLVQVPVTVVDGSGAYVDDLSEPDFRLLDNGVLRRFKVDSFATGVAPVALVVAVQTSDLSAAALTKIRRVGALVSSVLAGQGGVAGVLSFDESVRWTQPLTPDVNLAGTALTNVAGHSARRAPILDAVRESVKALEKYPQYRRVVVLLSESKDRGSDTPPEEAVHVLSASGVLLYAATWSAWKSPWTTRPGETPPAPPGPDLIAGIGEAIRKAKANTTEVLARATGGKVIAFNRLSSLERALTGFGEELRRQYVLSFVPEDVAPGYHELRVNIVRPGKLSVRARSGYWAGG